MTDRPSEAPAPQGVRDRQREETHKRLYECSLSVFRRDGFTAAKIDDIAKMAGVSRGTFYFHFPTKDDVLLELLGYVETRNAAAITSLSEDTPVEVVLDSFCNSMAAEWSTDPKLLSDTSIVALRTRSSGFDDVEVDPVRSALAKRFEIARARGELQGPLPANFLADFFLVNALAGAIGWTANAALDLRTVLEAVIQIFLHGARGNVREK